MLEHIVPIGFCILLCGLVFYILNKKITNVENKVNLMFQLIQEHEKKEKLRNNTISKQTTDDEISDDLVDVSDDDSPHSIKLESTNMKISENIIENDNSDSDEMNDEVSDDDSDEVSDDDSDNNLNIHGSLYSDNNQKIINLNIEKPENILETLSLKEITKTNTPTENTSENTSEKNYDNNSDDNQEILESNSIINSTSAEIDNINDDVNNEIDNINDDVNNEIDNISLSDKNEDNDDNDESENSKNVSEFFSKKKIDFNKFTVNDLREECEKRNLSGYKSLKKTALIDLLERS